MTAQVFLAPEAERQIRVVDAWWRKERSAAPNLFHEELSAGIALLSSNPDAGRRYSHPGVTDVRRILLRSSRYHVYYKRHEGVAIVLAVWSSVRGSGPDLK